MNILRIRPVQLGSPRDPLDAFTRAGIGPRGVGGLIPLQGRSCYRPSRADFLFRRRRFELFF